MIFKWLFSRWHMPNATWFFVADSPIQGIASWFVFVSNEKWKKYWAHFERTSPLLFAIHCSHWCSFCNTSATCRSHWQWSDRYTRFTQPMVCHWWMHCVFAIKLNRSKYDAVWVETPITSQCDWKFLLELLALLTFICQFSISYWFCTSQNERLMERG